MRERECNTNRTGRQNRRSSRREASKKHNKRGLVLIILCICVLGILGVAANLFFSNKDNQSKGTTIGSEKRTAETEATLQTVNKDALTKLINDTEQINKSVYTEESIAALDQNIEKAKELVAGNADQSDLDDCYMNTVKAIQNLQRADEASADTTEAVTNSEKKNNSTIGLQ